MNSYWRKNPPPSLLPGAFAKSLIRFTSTLYTLCRPYLCWWLIIHLDNPPASPCSSSTSPAMSIQVGEHMIIHMNSTHSNSAILKQHAAVLFKWSLIWDFLNQTDVRLYEWNMGRRNPWGAGNTITNTISILIGGLPLYRVEQSIWMETQLTTTKIVELGN